MLEDLLELLVRLGLEDRHAPKGRGLCAHSGRELVVRRRVEVRLCIKMASGEKQSEQRSVPETMVVAYLLILRQILLDDVKGEEQVRVVVQPVITELLVGNTRRWVEQDREPDPIRLHLGGGRHRM